MTYNKKDILEVIWRDAFSTTGWVSADEVEGLKNSDGLLMHTVGYYIGENDKYIFVVQTYDMQSSYGNVFFIPKKTIKEIRRIDTKRKTA